MTEKEFEELQNIGETDTKLPDTLEGIINKNNLLPSLIQRWTTLYTRLNYLYQNHKISLDELYGQLYKFYKFNDKYAWGTSKEIDSQIYSNKQYCDEARKLATEKYQLDYILETLGTLKGMHYTIKNYLDYKKIISTNM